MINSGVTLLDIQNFNGLTIFSRNGATIRHAEFNIKNGTNLILRNLRFDELWEWDEGTRGAYDANDWDFVTIGDGGGVTSGIWVDHCTFTKAYDGVLDIKKGASAITISWSEVVPAAAGPGSFVQQQFDDLEANRATNVMYNLLRGTFTQQQIVDIALPQKKGHLIGSTNLEPERSQYTVTLHHNYYKDLQDRMPRLRGGDVHGFNLFVDSSNARIVKAMRDDIVAANPTLASQLSSTYSFGITSQALDLDRRRRRADRRQRVLGRAHAVPQQPDRREQPRFHGRDPRQQYPARPARDRHAVHAGGLAAVDVLGSWVRLGELAGRQQRPAQLARSDTGAADSIRVAQRWADVPVCERSGRHARHAARPDRRAPAPARSA